MTQESRIFSYLINNPNKKPSQIAEVLGIPNPSVRRALFGLRKKGLITKPIKKDFKKDDKTTKQGYRTIKKGSTSVKTTTQKVKEFIKKLKKKKTVEPVWYRKIVKALFYENLSGRSKINQPIIQKFIITWENNKTNREMFLVDQLEGTTPNMPYYVIMTNHSYTDSETTPFAPSSDEEYPNYRIDNEI